MGTHPPKKDTAPQFSAHVCCGQMAGLIKMALGTEVGMGPGDIVLHGYPAFPPLKGHSPQFSANVRCGQTAGWTNMPLSMQVGVGLKAQATLFSMGTQLPQKKKHSFPTQFSAHVYCGNGRSSQLLLRSCINNITEQKPLTT